MGRLSQSETRRAVSMTQVFVRYFCMDAATRFQSSVHVLSLLDSLFHVFPPTGLVGLGLWVMVRVFAAKLLGLLTFKQRSLLSCCFDSLSIRLQFSRWGLMLGLRHLRIQTFRDAEFHSSSCRCRANLGNHILFQEDDVVDWGWSARNGSWKSCFFPTGLYQEGLGQKKCYTPLAIG